jgi:uncharacterized cupin superfamily protein
MSHPIALLLAYADGTPAAAFTPGALDSSDPFGNVRHVAYRGDDGVSAGFVQASVELVVEDYPYTEMLVVHAGKVSLQDEQQTLELSVGDSAVIGRGTALRVQAQAGSLWAFCTLNQGAEHKPGLTQLDARAALNPLASAGRADPHRPCAAMPFLQRLRRQRQRSADWRLGLHALRPSQPPAQGA